MNDQHCSRGRWVTLLLVASAVFGAEAARGADTLISAASVSGTKTVAGFFDFHEGTSITYTIVLTNTGSSPQPYNQVLTDPLPAGLTLLSANQNGGGYVSTAGDTIVLWTGPIPAGGSVTITIVARINSGTAGQTIANQGIIAFDTDGDGINDSTGVTDDPETPGITATSFVAIEGTTIPTLSELALALLALLLGGSAALVLRRPPRPAAAQPSRGGSGRATSSRS